MSRGGGAPGLSQPGLLRILHVNRAMAVQAALLVSLEKREGLLFQTFMPFFVGTFCSNVILSCEKKFKKLKSIPIHISAPS